MNEQPGITFLGDSINVAAEKAARNELGIKNTTNKAIENMGLKYFQNRNFISDIPNGELVIISLGTNDAGGFITENGKINQTETRKNH